MEEYIHVGLCILMKNMTIFLYMCIIHMDICVYIHTFTYIYYTCVCIIYTCQVLYESYYLTKLYYCSCQIAPTK